jgi:exodeoxyribonuclease III
MKFVSWNVNGLRAAREKGFDEIFKKFDADFFCLQEIKLQAGQIDMDMDGYQSYWNYAEKKGYSGTAIFTKIEPTNVFYGLGKEEHDKEGRLITLEYPNFYISTVYTPNSKQELLRLEYRQEWEDEFREFFKNLDAKKPVIICGDMNVAHKEIDLKNPKTNRTNPGFTDEEREKFTLLLDAGFTDTFRYFYPDKENEYSWWSYRANARKNNTGWRIDYFLVSDRLQEKLTAASIHQDVLGSDHCPVSVELSL